MVIKAYTFESPTNGSAQIVPYTSKVDARIRRDLFNGAGDLIFAGDRNGNLTDVIPGATIGGDLKVKFKDSTVFCAGGRLFSISEEVELSTSMSDVQGIGTAELVVDINTKSTDDTFVKIVDMPTHGQGFEQWEADVFSTTFTFILVQSRSGVSVYAGPMHVATNEAGAVFSLSQFGNSMEGYSSPWRGQMTSDKGNIRVSKCADQFTISGYTRSIVKYTEGAESGFKIAAHTLSPFAFNVKEGTLTIFTPGWVGLGTLSSDYVTPTGGHLFNVYDLRTISGIVPNSITEASLLGNFTGEWEML